MEKRHGRFINAVEELGKVVRQLGPLDEKAAHLIQLAAGATPEEIYHAVMLLTSTIGFPNVAAALSWAEDSLSRKRA
jgi:alkylhydroperoxidase/carboxymuconolactone decarboxylase family protein YurZ